MIVFGKNGVNQAYTVASNFTDAMLVMDDRQDQLIDVIVGATFENLQDTKEGSRRRQGDHRHPGLRRGGQDDRPAQGARA